ncbi:MAG: alkaline phosphatase D family protein [Flavobacteriales bacterium]|nr:alkaline phosphatase D family protein [Flavobacteriales bacterium]MCB9192608.1 alkaline phosphatase D family protein [Flavobacteriales bacterium]
MKHFNLLVFLLLPFLAIAQNDISQRSDVNPDMAPFYHGVASGDPLSDRVIIWTRYTPDVSSNPVTINWEVATDTGFSNVAQSGTFNTDADRDWTVKVDVTGLTDNTWYYFRFEYNGAHSITGRTRTAPTGMVDSLRFAVVSCSDYVDGYFHGYKQITERNDVDAVIHLGDYIYENGSEGSIGRPHEPSERITELDDYRQRYSQYRLDPDLRCVHQMYPFINVWDDHELANNAWIGGAEAHDEPADGLWEDRKGFAARAYHEWIPFREPNPSDSLQIYRSLQWGDLVDLFMADTRIIGRDEQDANAIDDPDRHILGEAQLGWLTNEMANSSAQWKVLGQQVMMGALEIPFIGIPPASEDSWNGYRWERENFYDTVLVHNIENLVVLTGDIHTAWAMNLEQGNDKVGVEFVCSSITTMNSPLSVPAAVITAANPHIKYAELTGHGYYILDINQERVQCDFNYVGNIEDPNDNSSTEGPYWYCSDATRELTEGNSASIPRAEMPILLPPNSCLSPEDTSGTGIGDEPIAAVFGTYPNPFWDDFVIKTYLFKQETVTTEVYDMLGALVTSVPSTDLPVGLHYLDVDASGLPKGNYIMKMTVGNKVFSRRVVKI